MLLIVVKNNTWHSHQSTENRSDDEKKETNQCHADYEQSGKLVTNNFPEETKWMLNYKDILSEKWQPIATGRVLLC